MVQEFQSIELNLKIETTQNELISFRIDKKVLKIVINLIDFRLNTYRIIEIYLKQIKNVKDSKIS